tara:strand:+ start:9791 stop:10234 length:444 start_codon:yes stop_codon:yes gene_type:complete
MATPTTTVTYGNIIPPKSIRDITLKDNKLIGFKYPFVAAPGNGNFSKSSGLDLIRSSIRSLLRTERGERFMLPDYGCNLRKFLMEPMDETTFRLIKEEIQTSFRKYLRQVSVSKIQVFETRQNNIEVKLFCSLRDAKGSNFGVQVRI